jgi:hypothetical protein
MSTGELHQGQPVLRFLAPAQLQAAPLRQPTQCALHHPATGWVTVLSRSSCRLLDRFVPSATVVDMGGVAGCFHPLMHIGRIVGSIGTKVLLPAGPLGHDTDHQACRAPFVMPIGTRDVHRQRRSALIHQNVYLAPAFGPVSWVLARGFTAQGSSARATIDRLPLPADPPPASIEAQRDLEETREETLLLPGLKVGMERAGGDTDPVTVDCFPLAAGPQDVPQAVEDGTSIHTWSSFPPVPRRLGQKRFEAAPERTRHAEVVNRGWFGGSMAHTVSSLVMMS